MLSKAVARRCSVKKVFLEVSQNSQENSQAEACNFIKKETLGQVFPYEFCEISKNTFSCKTPPVVASVSCSLPFFNEDDKKVVSKNHPYI